MKIETEKPYASENALAHIKKLLDIAVECESGIIRISEDMYVMHRGRKFKVNVTLEGVDE